VAEPEAQRLPDPTQRPRAVDSPSGSAKTNATTPDEAPRRDVGRIGKPERNELFLQWYEVENADTFHSPAAIRDKWNAENPRDKINESTADNGLGAVKQILRRARIKRNSERGTK